MPTLGNLIKVQSVIYKLKCNDRKEVLSNMAKLASVAYGVDEISVLENTLTRESLGGTGVGEGVAVPHARIKDLDHSVGVFALLENPIDFEAPDGIGSDLIFLLLSPEDSGANHLKALAKITRALRQPALRSALRSARSQQALFAVLTDAESEQVA